MEPNAALTGGGCRSYDQRSSWSGAWLLWGPTHGLLLDTPSKIGVASISGFCLAILSLIEVCVSRATRDWDELPDARTTRASLWARVIFTGLASAALAAASLAALIPWTRKGLLACHLPLAALLFVCCLGSQAASHWDAEAKGPEDSLHTMLGEPVSLSVAWAGLFLTAASERARWTGLRMAAAGGAGLGTVCMVADLTEGATPVEAAARASGKTVVFFMLCTSWTALLGPRYRTGKSVLRAAQAAAVAACVVLPASVAVAAWRLAGPMPLRGRGHSEVAGHWEPLLAAMVVACCGVAFGGWVWSARVATWQREELLGDVMPMDVARSVMRNWGIEQATSARNAGKRVSQITERGRGSVSAKSPRESRRKKSVSGSLARPSERRGKSVSIAPLAASDGTRTRGRGQARGTPGTSRLGREGQESRSTFHGASSRAIVPRPTAEASILAFEALALRRGRASSEDNALVPDGDAGAEPNFGRSRAVAALSSPGGPVSGGPENDDNVGEPLGDLDGPFRLWGSISGFEALSLAYFREHKEISVLFADLVGFTELAGMLSPRQTLATLHSLWSILDRVSSYLGCHKYETVGDSWIAVSNLGGEEAGGEHRERALAMGVALLVIMGSIHVNTPQGRVRINARVGLHSGPVAAGVLGKKRKLMSLCGDTMNVASRCESTAPPGHIQATRHFWEGLSSPVRELFVQREVAVKGKGLMDMFVLDVSTQEDALSDLGFNLVRDPERWQLVLDA